MKKIPLTAPHIKSIATLLESGLSPFDVFLYIRDSFFAKNKKIFEQLIAAVSSGDDFVSIFSYTTLSDSYVYNHLIASSQANGSIPEGLRDIGSDMETKAAQSRTFIQLLIYPSVVAIVLGLIIFVILLYVVPQLKPIIMVGGGSGQDIPKITYILMSLSSVLINHTFTILVSIIGSVVIFLGICIHPAYKRYLYTTCLKVPILSHIVNQHIWSQIARLLFYYTKSGSNIVSAFSAVLTVAYLPHQYRQLFTNLISDIGKGGVLSDITSSYRDIPVLWTLYLRIGETKVGYNIAFSNIMKMHEENTLRQIAYIQRLIEPVLMICIGVIVGIFAYAILLPIYGLVQTLQS
jgi:type II secretory pathway component PulF